VRECDLTRKCTKIKSPVLELSFIHENKLDFDVNEQIYERELETIYYKRQDSLIMLITFKSSCVHWFTCIAINCGKAPAPHNAIPLFDEHVSTAYGSRSLSYTCRTGTWFSRDIMTVGVSCTINGTWIADTKFNKWPTCTRESKYFQCIELSLEKMHL
jgi:hypothetical protein